VLQSANWRAWIGPRIARDAVEERAHDLVLAFENLDEDAVLVQQHAAHVCTLA